MVKTKKSKQDLKEYKQQWYLKNRNPEKEKAYREKHRESRNRYFREYRQRKKEECRLRDKKYYEDNKEILLEKQKQYKNKNRKKINKAQNKKYHEDINYRLRCNLRNRLRMALKQNQKIGSAVKDLGCTIEQFKIYLESKFQPGMTWDNYGKGGWEIDHIYPLSKVDLNNIEEFLRVNHYTNLQPLWAKDNNKKKDKIGSDEEDK